MRHPAATSRNTEQLKIELLEECSVLLGNALCYLDFQHDQVGNIGFEPTTPAV